MAALWLGVRGALPGLHALATNSVSDTPPVPIATDAPAAFAQGQEEFGQRHYAEAVASFSQAIKLKPDWEEAYMRRGVAKEGQNNLYGALEDFSHAIKLNPRDAAAYERHARILEISGDFSKSVTDINEALQLRPSWDVLYFRRGVTNMILGQWDAAVSDLQTFCERRPQVGNADYAHLYLWYVAHEQGKAADADQALAAYFAGQNSQVDPTSPAQAWTPEIAGFLLGKVPEDDLLAQANSTDARRNRHLHCEAWFYIGLKALVAGDKTGATTDFQNCVSNGQIHLAEHEFANAKLKEWSGNP